MQLTLKIPKTSKTLPYQVVEIPVTDNFLGPVQALDAWVGAREIKPIGAKTTVCIPRGPGVSHTKVYKHAIEKCLPRSKPHSKVL